VIPFGCTRGYFKNIQECCPGGLQLFDLLWPSERSGFEEAVHVAKKRVAEGALTMRLDQALAGVIGYDGMIKLQQVVTANSELFELVPSAVRDRQNAKVGEKIHSALKPLMADERQRIDQLGAGGEALKNGSRWYAAFSQKYLSHFTTRKSMIRSHILSNVVRWILGRERLQ
jgi:hypothetical protein